MTPVILAAYAASLFGALAALLKWKYRRMANARRVRRGLRTFISQEHCRSESNPPG